MCWCFIHYWIEKCTVKHCNIVNNVQPYEKCSAEEALEYSQTSVHELNSFLKVVRKPKLFSPYELM